MTSAEILDIGREALIVLLKVAGPLLLIALITGLLISLLQALTQIQENTLVFVPKSVLIFLTLILMLPYMGQILKTFTEHIFDKMISVT